MIKIDICGTSGIPIAIYPENESSSKEGAAFLTRERTNFLKRYADPASQSQSIEKIGGTSKDTSILSSIMSSTLNAESRKKVHTLDFQLCDSSSAKTRCLTLMNLSDIGITVGLSPQSPNLSCPYLVRIAPQSAHAVEIVLSFKVETNGIFNSAINLVSEEFENIPIHVTGFVGNPINFRMSKIE